MSEHECRESYYKGVIANLESDYAESLRSIKSFKDQLTEAQGEIERLEEKVKLYRKGYHNIKSKISSWPPVGASYCCAGPNEPLLKVENAELQDEIMRLKEALTKIEKGENVTINYIGGNLHTFKYTGSWQFMDDALKPEEKKENNERT